MSPELETLIEQAREYVKNMTPDQRREMERRHAISFAYGNCVLDGCNVTYADVAAAYDALTPSSEACACGPLMGNGCDCPTPSSEGQAEKDGQ